MTQLPTRPSTRSSSLFPTLARAVTRQSDLSFTSNALLILGGAAFVAVCAQISIPLQPVPLTLQTLAVLLVGAALGAHRGAAALLAYLAAGAAGLPVFAGGGHLLVNAKTGGLTPTFGYLIGFILAAGLIGWLCQRFGADRTPWGTAAAMLAGNAVIYAAGLPVLAALLGLKGQALLNAGLTPFLFGDALKLVLAAALLPGAWALLRRR